MALFHNGLFIVMLGCFLPVAWSSSPFLRRGGEERDVMEDTRKEERDAVERAIMHEADGDNLGDVAAPPPSNREGPEITMPAEMGRQAKKIQLHEENNPWTEPAPEDEAEKLAKKEKGKERPDFMTKIFDNGKNLALAEKQAEDQDARANAAQESLNGDTTMAGKNNAIVAAEEARKNLDGHDSSSTDMIASDYSNWDPLVQNLGHNQY